MRVIIREYERDLNKRKNERGFVMIKSIDNVQKEREKKKRGRDREYEKTTTDKEK